MTTDTHTCGAVAVPTTTQPAWDDVTRALRTVVQQEIEAAAKSPAPELVDLLRDVYVYFHHLSTATPLTKNEARLLTQTIEAINSLESKR